MRNKKINLFTCPPPRANMNFSTILINLFFLQFLFIVSCISLLLMQNCGVLFQVSNRHICIVVPVWTVREYVLHDYVQCKLQKNIIPSCVGFELHANMYTANYHICTVHLLAMSNTGEHFFLSFFSRKISINDCTRYLLLKYLLSHLMNTWEMIKRFGELIFFLFNILL